jgi:excisionase family DNA binding protein
MDTQREFLTTAEIADRLGLTQPTVRRYILHGKLKSVRLEGGFRVRLKDLEEFLQAREYAPTETQILPAPKALRKKAGRPRGPKGGNENA